MELSIGLIAGIIIGICITSICVAARSKVILTNADRLSLDASRLAELMYNSDDYGDIGCPAKFDEQFDEVTGCRFPNEQNGCIKCIKEWLGKEVYYEQ